MSEYPSGTQPNGSSYTKTFTPYVQTAKTFQPYTPPSININAPLQQNKTSQTKNQQRNGGKKVPSPLPVSRSNINSNNIPSSKAQNPTFKPIPTFLEGRNAMKGSMMNIQNQTQSKASKVEQYGLNLSPSRQQLLLNSKKSSRNNDSTDNPSLKQSSMELGTQGTKIPSFLNKQKKVPYSADSQRPQSSKQVKQVTAFQQQTSSSLTSSVGNLKKLQNQGNFTKVASQKDPATQWAKLSWNKKKQKNFSLDDFQQIKQLGTGKYGRVFLARQKQTNFICALKVLQKSLIKSQQITQQQIRQLKIQSFLNHTNLIKMYGFFDDAKNIYLILQAATGGQLFKQLKKHQSIPEPRVASIMRQVCNAVNQLHSNRIIHRDIKPQNIVLHDNILKLCDFGWSVYCDSNLRTTFCGTPLYVGPQILKGKQYDEKIDIWSLGVMMYEMLVGENPFKITKQQQLIKIIKDDIKIPTYVEISEECKSFLFSCLQKNPQNRLSIRQLLNHDFFKKYPEKDKKL